MVAALRTMRIVAVPLTRPRARIQLLTDGRLNRYTYYQIQLPPKKSPSQLKSEKNEEGTSTQEEKKSWLPEEGVVNWATQKAADIWAGFGKAEGGWKLKTYQAGEKLVDRIEFEEQVLKNFDPSLALPAHELEKNLPPNKFPLLYPPSVLSSTTALSDLRAFVELRIPRHRKGFLLWMFIAPFTAPFMLIPVIPNLPFFFCVWRSWSHYRAHKSSKYLQTLLEHNLIEPQESELLDQVYRTYRISPSASDPSTLSQRDTSFNESSTEFSSPESSSTDPNSTSDVKLDFSSGAPENTLLLKREAVPTLLSVLDLQNDSFTATELYRAIDQTRARISIKS